MSAKGSSNQKDGYMKVRHPSKNAKNVESKALTRFDRVYKKLGDKLIPESKRIDMVLIHRNPDFKIESLNAKDRKKVETRQRVREVFEDSLRKEGFLIEKSVHKEKVYKKIHCPFKRLCIEAETTNLEMPLLGLTNPEQEPTNLFTRFIYDKFVTDKAAIDYITARFMVEKIHLFDNYHDPTNFFRPSIRTLLVNHILLNMNIRQEVDKEDIMYLDDDIDFEKDHYIESKKSDTIKSLGIEGELQKLNFPYMKHIGVYTEKLILHEASEESKIMEDQDENSKDEEKFTEQEPEIDLEEDPRRTLSREWTSFFKFQPLTKIRNYFGEKIAFYFAWSGTLITTLWVPMILGLAIFIFGIVKSASESLENEVNGNDTASGVTNILTVIKLACDNDATPYYALIICVWGTLFLELWKRKTASLAYEWDVDEFEETEPDRPEFYGTKQRIDPVTEEDDWYYPMKKQLVKFMFSALTLTFMVCLVLASVLSVIIYRVITSVRYCPDISPQACVLLTTVISSLLNTISILILGKIYDILARKLTDWENHRTQTMYDDALIVKLFAFQFANNYTSCFYIAFVRGRFGQTGIFGFGSDYTDDCEPNGNCMSELSFQILILMIAKPMPKLFTDVIIPFAKRLWKRRPQCCCNRRVDGVHEKLTFTEKEALKPSLGDFTVGEYTEKVIQYGFLMLFAASLPLAPLLALLTNFVDIRVDAKRMLWWYRRPLATIAEDIGTWFIILQFVNFCGVVSNGFLIGFTSSWGRSQDKYTQLWIVLGFEHIVFALKFILAYIIPDVPREIQLASRKNMHHMTVVMRKDRDRHEKELAVLLKGSPTHQPQGQQNEMPAVYMQKERVEEWQPTEEEHIVRSSPKQKRRHRVDEEEEHAYEDVEYSPTRKLKKRKKKKKHHHQDRDEEDDVPPPPYNDQPQPKYYTTEGEDRHEFDV